MLPRKETNERKVVINMRYFGIPTCPYCKKRVNLIRTWSLKRQGEYQCPRCGGISNIFLSPLIHVFAVLAVFSGGALYFFHKFILDDISLDTVWQILVPFALFFVLSLFMVYLVKPVIKKVPRAELERKKRGKANFEERRSPAVNTAGQAGQMFYDSDEYLPKIDYRTGPLPQMEDDRDMKILPGSSRSTPYSDELQKTSVVDLPSVRPAGVSQRPASAQAPRQAEDQRERQPRPSAAQPVSQQRPVRPQTTAQTPAARASSAARPAQARQTAPQNAVSQPSRVVTSVDIPSVSDNFFAKYDDPEYVERRLKELKEQRGERE